MHFVILTGLIAGFIHVVSGADHLIAMAPSSITRPKQALRNSYSWSLGHSSGVVILAILGIFIKDIASINKFSHFAEFLVGISLLIVGVYAIKSYFNLRIHYHSHEHNNGISHQHMHIHGKNFKRYNNHHSHALTGLGLLHGFAGGSHLLAILPALALPIPNALAYLSAYLIGSFISMNLFTVFISFTTLNAGQKFIKRLIAFAGGLSFCMGLFWVQKSASFFVT